jgi:hypothetical protein
MEENPPITKDNDFESNVKLAMMIAMSLCIANYIKLLQNGEIPFVSADKNKQYPPIDLIVTILAAVEPHR